MNDPDVTLKVRGYVASATSDGALWEIRLHGRGPLAIDAALSERLAGPVWIEIRKRSAAELQPSANDRIAQVREEEIAIRRDDWQRYDDRIAHLTRQLDWWYSHWNPAIKKDDYANRASCAAEVDVRHLTAERDELDRQRKEWRASFIRELGRR